MFLDNFSNENRKWIMQWQREEEQKIWAAKKLKFWHRVSAFIIFLEIAGFVWLGLR